MLHHINPGQTTLRTPAFAGFSSPPTSQLDDRLETVGTLLSYGRDEEIFGEGELSTRFYKVMSGSVRTYKILDDGRRQIVGFHLPGDFFGLELFAADEKQIAPLVSPVIHELLALEQIFDELVAFLR